MPTPRRPPAVSIEPLVPGSGSRRRCPNPPFGAGLSTPAPPPAQRPRPGTPASTGVSAAASGPTHSLSTARHSPGHHDGVPAGARDAALSLSLLRGLPSPYISFAPTFRVAVPHGAETRGSSNGSVYRCVACDARLNSLFARHDCPGPASNEPFHPLPVLPEELQLRALLGPLYHGTACARGIHPICTSSQPTAAYGDSLQFLWHGEFTISQPSSFRYHLPSTASTTDSTNRFPVSKTSWRQVFHIDTIFEHRVGHQQFGHRFSVGVKFRGSPSVPGTPPTKPPDPGPPSTTGEVSSTPGSSSRRHTGPDSTSSASRASSRMSTELADAPATDDYDDASANEPVDEQSVPAAGTVVDHHPLSTNSRSSSSPFLSEQLEDNGAEDADDDAQDIPVEAPTMEMPPDHTVLLVEHVRVLRATLRSDPTPDSWVT
ncbi:hypothetical protein MRX96_046372 [Rhipicephalus microplus]